MLRSLVKKENIKSTLILTTFTMIIWSLLSGILMNIFGFVKSSTSNPSSSLKSLLSLFFLCTLNAIMVIWYTKKSFYSGKKLFINIMILIFGIMSFMTQIETLYFNKTIKMPLLMILITVFTCAMVGIFSGMFAVKIKEKTKEQIKNEYELKMFSTKKNIVKFIFLSFLYLILYFFFGYFIAWQFPLLRQFYSGSTDILSFWAHMQNQIQQDSFLIVFQIFRGFLWTLIGYTLLKGLSIKNHVEKYILMGLLLSVPLAAPLLVPNDFMPPYIRLGHFFELLIENFLFGVILTYMLSVKNKR